MKMFEDAIIRYVQAEPTEDVRDVISPLLEDADAIDLNSYPARLAYSLCRVKKLFDDDSIHRLDTSVLPNREYLVFKKLKQLVSEMLPSDEYEKKLQQIDDDGTEKLKQPVSEFPLPFACVPWGHHVRIVQHSISDAF
jgi:hypothetical protein